MDVDPMGTGKGRAFKAEGTAWTQDEGWPLGPQKVKLRKEGAIGRVEGVFFL